MARDRDVTIRYLLFQVALGCLVGIAFGSALLLLNAANIRSLLAGDITSTVIFFAGAVMTFCPLVVATAVGLLPLER